MALVDHWNSLPRKAGEAHRIVDIGTGSGIQALTMATMLQQSPESMKTKVTCVDLNPRALRLARLNFAWNGLPEPEWILGDLRVEHSGRRLLDDDTMDSCYSACKSWKDWIGHPTMILSNPPFLPVPIQDDNIAKRHGLYSSGGKSGEEVLRRVTEIAAECLAPDGTLAVVSEFMNPQTTLSSRLSKWWQGPGKAVLITNEQAMDASTYSSRRADSMEEFERWLDHLSMEGISHISPGLLFIKKIGGCTDFDVSNLLVPKTIDGSIWTPTNRGVREYTRKKLTELGLYSIQ
jgi:tRNA1(Val) A37 N6-methylase TrmN6